MDEPVPATTSLAGDAARPSQQLARERDRLKLLLEINNAIISHLDLDQLLHSISDGLRRVVPHDLSGIGLYDPETGQLHPHALVYPDELPFLTRGASIPMEHGVHHCQPVFLSEPDFERFNSDYARKIHEAGFNSGGSVPQIAHGRKLGVLSVASWSNRYDLVVIGSGPAGQKGAIAAAKMGKRVSIVGRAKMIGGVCLHTGTIPSKTLREGILYLTGFRQRTFYGRDYTLKSDIVVSDLATRIRAGR